MDIKEKISAAVQKYFDTAVRLSRNMAANPEISNEETEASAEITAVLKAAGFAAEYPFCGLPTAFRGTFVNGAGKSCAFVVEYDALPGVGHGCGHNLHGALSVLAGLAMKDLSAEWKGTLYVTGTPAEEAEGRKIDMADAGVFDGLCFAGMMHSFSGPYSVANAEALGLRQWIISFTGKPSHAAGSPWDGISALACARVFLAMMDARRECFTKDMVFNAVFVDGGAAPNIIPETAALKIDARAATLENLQKLERVVKKCAEGASVGMECALAIEKCGGDFAPWNKNAALDEKIYAAMEARGFTMGAKRESTGSTDMANVSQKCPAVHPHFSVAEAKIPGHSKEFAAACLTPQAEDAMRRGAEALVETALWAMK